MADDMREAKVMKDFLMEAASGIGPTLGPEEDWMPTAFLVAQDGSMVISPLIEWGDDDERADTIAALALVIEQREIVTVGMVHTIWMLMLFGGTTEEALNTSPRPRDHPQRSEAVMVMALTAEEVAMASAAIERHKDSPPTIREWIDEPGEVEGALSTPILEALRKVRYGRS